MRISLTVRALVVSLLLLPLGDTSVYAQETPLTLQAAVLAALRNNEAAGQAEARTDRSRALLREAYGSLLPSLQLTGTYTRRDEEIVRNVGGTSAVIQNLNALSANATARTTLFSAPAIPLVRGARRAAEAAEFGEESVKRELARNTAEAYVAVLAADELIAAAEDRVAFAERIVTEARARAGAGLANKTDVTRAEVEHASAQLALTEIRNTALRARNALAFLTAMEISSPLTTPTFPAPASGSAADLTTRALDERHDLKASSLAAESARLRAQAPWLQYTPSLGLEGTYRTTNESGLSGDNDSWFIAAVATWTLFDGGIAAARAGQAKADATIASLDTSRLRRSISVDVDNALADLETARAAIVQAELAARAATELRDEVSQRFSYGLASGLEQADAAVSAYEAQSALARRQLELHSAQLRLSAALGEWPAGITPDSQSQK